MVGCLGIRREDKNVWERRTPLIPQHIHQLIRDHRIQVIVQPQENRAFSNAEYAAAGAEVSADLSPCDLILAVKEIPADQILSNKALLFFSHTLKGQRQNMPMLRRILALGNTLIDYECIKDDSGKRVVFFGRYAGMAGMIETLHALGRRLTDVGIKTALAEINSAHQYASLDEAKLHIVNIGDRIRKTGLPPEICPLVCGFCGYGNVSVGAQEIFDLLPVHNVDPDSLPLLAAEPGNIFYKVVFHERHTVAAHQPVDDFVLEHYWAHPQQYRSVFDRYLPYLTLVLNGVYWDSRFPRLITRESLRQRGQPLRLRVIGDISCDIGGAVEMTEMVTTPDAPYFIYDPVDDRIHQDEKHPGIAIMAVDNLPGEIARESSIGFSHMLFPFMPGLINTDFTQNLEMCGLSQELKRAAIAYHGKLLPDFEYLAPHLNEK